MTTDTKPQTGPEGVKLGDFFVCSWGYDQTNVDFYKVVGMTPKTVKIQKWVGAVVDADSNYSQDKLVPGSKPATYTDWSAVDHSADYWTRMEQTVERDAPVQTKRVRDYAGRPVLTMNSYSNAYLWDGKPEYQTAAGFGH